MKQKPLPEEPKNIKCLLILAMALGGSPANASEWFYIGYTVAAPNRQAIFAEAQSIGDDGSYKTVWTQSIFETEDRLGVSSFRSLNYIDCGKRKGGEMQITLFGKNGDIIPRPRHIPDMQFIAPDPMGEIMLTFVCSKERQGALRTDGDNLQFAKQNVFKQPQ